MRDGAPAYRHRGRARPTSPTAGATTGPAAALLLTCRAARSSAAACRCRIRRASMTASSGCSIPAPANSARSTSQAGRFEPIAFCPGYLRGLAFLGDHARRRPVGAAREPHLRRPAAAGPSRRAKVEPRCGLYVIDLKTGDVAHWLRIEGVVPELYDVVALPQSRAVDDRLPQRRNPPRGIDRRVTDRGQSHIGDQRRYDHRRPAL